MKITIVAVGGVRDNDLKKRIQQYSRRLSVYCRIQLIEVREEKTREVQGLSEQGRNLEGARILSHIGDGDYVIALANEGHIWSPRMLSNELDRLVMEGRSQITLVMGGEHGLSAEVLERANAQLAICQTAFPHQLLRLVLMERVYRAFQCSLGEPIHRMGKNKNG
ncbi:hypothetical protein AN963_18225 [Brevibacillus choshinensis]|uniref:Ribosomal RNA large subunit methyltransferase H n=1 Tax=Brevibacillus choshinensis TaxID=54911 RepID=A0ABR5N862_BRECH|nr:23S rRNA (pseudouridine(1915)-N(3))-methyltransferase RlmH [Brevibacillus choshinensis]KQL46833.1 hypothetical protein AN963_18225 [Brevibacillus choshinensis]